MSASIIITIITVITTGFCDMTVKPHMSSESIKPAINLTINSSSTISSSLFTEGGVTDIKNHSAHSTEVSSSLSTNKSLHLSTTESMFPNKTTNNTHVHKISSRKDVKFNVSVDTKVLNNSVTERVITDNFENQLNNTSISLNATKNIKSTTGFDNVSVTTAKSVPKKPLVTIGDDEPYAPSNFQPKGSKPLLKNNSDIKLDNVLQAPESHYKKPDVYEPDYVVPVVITILSIPLLVGFAMLMFKLGTNWWERRHYRRMDYLIEGMYNNSNI